MGKVIKNSSGQVVLSGDKALEVTAAIDSNIVAGNIKKDVEILGVTGTYEGSGGGGATAVQFYCMITTGYYINTEDAATIVPFDPASGLCSFTCPSKSLIYIESEISSSAPSQITGATLVYSATHGSRNAVYVWILQAN